jgi:hypothetical protein
VLAFDTLYLSQLFVAIWCIKWRFDTNMISSTNALMCKNPNSKQREISKNQMDINPIQFEKLLLEFCKQDLELRSLLYAHHHAKQQNKPEQ